jgi:hypothetical protein
MGFVKSVAAQFVPVFIDLFTHGPSLHICVTHWWAFPGSVCADVVAHGR